MCARGRLEAAAAPSPKGFQQVTSHPVLFFIFDTPTLNVRTLASTGLSEELPENGDVPEVSAVSPGAIGGPEFNFGN